MRRGEAGRAGRAGAALRSRTVDLALLAVAAVWGTSYALTKDALTVQPVLGFLAVRFALTALALAPALVRGLLSDAVALARVGLPLGAILLGVFLCETYGVLHTSAANAAVLISLCVVMTPFVEWAVLGARPSAGLLAAVACACAGAWLIAGGVEARLGLGDALILAAALLRAVMVTATRALTSGFEGSSLALTGVQALVVAAGAATLALAADPAALEFRAGARTWAVLAWLVLACTVFAFFAQNYASRRASPSRVSLLMGTEPVFGVLFAMAWLGERPGAWAWAGIALVVGACLHVTSRPVRGPASAA